MPRQAKPVSLEDYKGLLRLARGKYLVKFKVLVSLVGFDEAKSIRRFCTLVAAQRLCTGRSVTLAYAARSVRRFRSQLRILERQQLAGYEIGIGQDSKPFRYSERSDIMETLTSRMETWTSCNSKAIAASIATAKGRQGRIASEHIRKENLFYSHYTMTEKESTRGD